MSNPTASEAIKSQHFAISQAIASLQEQLDKMTSEISPDTESWRDVAEFAHVADLARTVNAAFDEWNGE